MPPEKSLRIHLLGVGLFLFIPLVLFLYVRYPLGILPSFVLGVLLMFSHRFVAVPFMNRYRASRCFWCGKTSPPRTTLAVRAGKLLDFQFCVDTCLSLARRFFDFCSRYRFLFRIGIFLPLAWYVISMLLVALEKFDFPNDWNRFIFQFFIAITVGSISFLYRTGKEVEQPSFPFPIHNLFLLGAKNTLLVFRCVSIWWMVLSILFLIRSL